MLNRWPNYFDTMEDADLLERSRQVAVIMLHRYDPRSWIAYDIRRVSKDLHYLLDSTCTWDDWDHVHTREDICYGNGLRWFYFPKDKPLWMYYPEVKDPTKPPIV